MTHQEDVYPVPLSWCSSKVDGDGYARDYGRSLSGGDGYWLEQARRLDWVVAPSVADQSSFAEADFGIRWFADGTLNVAANCLDRHLAER
ncbi:MAG: acetyl-coenzyme A synthetase, partial [Sphingobium sp.]